MPNPDLAPAHAPVTFMRIPAMSRWIRARRGGALPLLLTVLSIGACTDRAERADGAAAGGGPTVAPDVVFRTLDGDRLALREAFGPTLVGFWSTTCTICLAEMPALARLREDYAPRGFEFVAVAMPHDRPDAVLELAEAGAWAFPVAIDIEGVVLAAFEPVPGTPTSFLIDAAGQVVERHVGAHDIEALRRRLDRLLDDEPLVVVPPTNLAPAGA